MLNGVTCFNPKIPGLLRKISRWQPVICRPIRFRLEASEVNDCRCRVPLAARRCRSPLRTLVASLRLCDVRLVSKIDGPRNQPFWHIKWRKKMNKECITVKQLFLPEQFFFCRSVLVKPRFGILLVDKAWTPWYPGVHGAHT